MVRIFLSAVSSELKPAREIAARVLHSLGYYPVYQEEFPTGAGDLRAFLRALIDPCAGVLQLVGRRYGAEPAEIDPHYGRISYTQYEAEYARRAGKKVWYILVGKDAALPEGAPEGDERRALQAAYRERVEKGAHLYHQAADATELELRVHRLKDELTEFRQVEERRGRRVLALSVAGLLLAAGITWAAWNIRDEQGRQRHTLVAMQSKKERRPEELLAALRELPERISRPTEGGVPKTDEERTAPPYAELEKKHGLKSGVLAVELPAFANTLLARTDTSALDRAKALFVLKRFPEAEKEALAAKDQVLAAVSKAADDAIHALVLAGHSAREQVHDGRAKAHWERGLEHFRSAAALISKERDAARWAEVQASVVSNLDSLSRFDEALPILREVIAMREKTLGAEHPDTLTSINNLVLLLENKADYAGAELLCRRALEASERTLGAEHPTTVMSVNNLAMLRFQQGDYEAAEPLNRRALEARERTLGADHPSTLMSVNNLAVLLSRKGDYDAAEPLLRQALEAYERTMGPEHRSTLISVNSLAVLLESKGDSAEAELLYRRALNASERALGVEHLDTSHFAFNLAVLLRNRSRVTEAAALARQAYRSWLKIKGSAHEDTRDAAKFLRDLGEKVEE